MCRSPRVKGVTSPSAATVHVTSLVTTRKRSSLWWTPTTTTFVESPKPANQSAYQSLINKHQESGISCSSWPGYHRLFWPPDSWAESRLNSYFLPCRACSPDRHAAAASMWLASSQTMTRNSHVQHRLQIWKETCQQTTQASKAVTYPKCCSPTDYLSLLLLCIWAIMCYNPSPYNYYYFFFLITALWQWMPCFCGDSFLSAGSLPFRHFIACMVSQRTQQSQTLDPKLCEPPHL